jgi:C4-dicarboxylate-specific signal transduction histidine kinase
MARQIASICPETPINSDPVLLQQVFVNLIERHGRDGGTLGPASHHDQQQSGAPISKSPYETGPGLPADVLGTLFTPFISTKPHGLGIGLAIARTIVEAHEGRISAQNHPDGGAIFSVILRLAQTLEPLPASPTVESLVGESLEA